MYINAMGSYVPTTRIDNSYFEKTNGLTDEWIRQRTGICTRSRAGEGENVNTMGLAATEEAVKRMTFDVAEINLIVAAHYCTYDSVGTVAHEVQRAYDINHAKAVYASSACSSFINGLEIIEGYFASGKADKAILVCSEHNTYFANEHDPKSGHLWGDAAVTFIITKERMNDSDIRIIDIFTEGLGNIGKGPLGVKLRPKEDGITMPDGRDVFLHACRYMIYALNKSLANCNLKPEDISRFICHQANKRIVAQVAHLLNIADDRFLNNIEELGNTGSASAPLVFAQNIDSFKKGDKAALMVFGGGYSCGCFIVEI